MTSEELARKHGMAGRDVDAILGSGDDAGQVARQYGLAATVADDLVSHRAQPKPRKKAAKKKG